MKEEPDSLPVPYNFARCFNDQCPQASKCLRHIATQLDTTDHLYISIVNPARYHAAVSYTHLTLPTNSEVDISGGRKTMRKQHDSM